MNKIKIGTVQVNNSFSGQNYLPLSLGFLVSYAEMHCKNFNDFEFLNPIYKRVPIKDAVEQYKDCDIVAFSVYVWNNNISMRIAKALKEVNPNILTLVGGCHIPERPEYIEKYMSDHPYVDIASIGEGERVFTDFLENYPKRTWENVESLIYRNGDKLITTQQAERIKDMNEIPSPFVEGYFDSLIKDNPHERWIGLWETNRGCPFACTFCDWGVGFKKKVSKYNLEDRLFYEIDWFSKNKVEFVFACDANFGMYKDRDLPIVKKFAENKEKYGYPEALSVQNTKNSNEVSYQVQKLLSDTGLSKGALIAFQSLDPKTLKAIKYVDEVVTYQTEEELTKLIEFYNPDIRILGDDYIGKRFTGDHLSPKVIYTTRSHGWSTTKLKDMITKQTYKQNPKIKDDKNIS